MRMVACQMRAPSCSFATEELDRHNGTKLGRAAGTAAKPKMGLSRTRNGKFFRINPSVGCVEYTGLLLLSFIRAMTLLQACLPFSRAPSRLRECK